MTERKKTSADLRNYYTIFIELGLLFSLVILIITFRINIMSPGPGEIEIVEKELAEIEEIMQIQPIDTPPPPPRPPVPVEVPNDEIIEDIHIDIGGDLDIGGPLNTPPPLPPVYDEDEETVFEIVEHMPEIIGGAAALYEKIKYPESARRAGIQGRVIVQFIVNEQGYVENPVIIRGVHPAIDEEAIRVIRETRFRPGMQRGRTVRVQISQPIFFRLQ